MSKSEEYLNKTLWALFVVAIVYAVAHHVWLVNVPARVSWAPPLGVICYDFAVAYAGAFTFYLLNVRLPLRRDRQNIYRHVGPLVGLIITQGKDVITKLNETARVDPSDRDNTWPNIQEMCSKISTDSYGANLYIGANGVNQHTVFTLIVDNMNRTHSWIECILRYSTFLASDLIDLLAAFETYTQFRIASEHIVMLQSGLRVLNKDLSVWARPIYNFTQLLSELEIYGLNYLPMTYEDRADLMPPESDTAAKPLHNI